MMGHFSAFVRLYVFAVAVIQLVVFVASAPRPGPEHARIEVAFHHVAPGIDVAPQRAPKLEPVIVDDDVLPKTALLNDNVAFVTPPTPDQIWLVVGVLPNVGPPMLDADVVDNHLLRAICPLAFDHLRFPGDTWSGVGLGGSAGFTNFRLWFHSTGLANPFLLVSQEG